MRSPATGLVVPIARYSLALRPVVTEVDGLVTVGRAIRLPPKEKPPEGG
jgi:hypothetical protein